MNSPRPSSNVPVETPVIDGVSLEEYKARVGLSADNRVLDGALRYHEARVKAQRGPVEDAVVLYKRLLDLLPDEPWVYEDLVGLYMLRGATPAAQAAVVEGVAEPGEAKPTEAKPAEPKQKRGAKLPRKSESLGQVLQQMGLVTAEQLTQALEIQSRTGERLGQILLDMKVITEVQLAQAMGRQWGYRYVSLGETRIDPDAVKLVPHSLALRLRMMPIHWERGRLALAMIDPLNGLAVDDGRPMTGRG